MKSLAFYADFLFCNSKTFKFCLSIRSIFSNVGELFQIFMGHKNNVDDFLCDSEYQIFSVWEEFLLNLLTLIVVLKEGRLLVCYEHCQFVLNCQSG